MRRFAFLLSSAAIIYASSALAQAEMTLDSDEKKLSYTIGVDIGNNFRSQDISVDIPAFVEGMRDVFEEKTLKLTEEEMENVMTTFQEKLIAEREKRFEALAEENKKLGEKFLKENKGKKEVVTLPSGLQYKIVKEGKGEKPQESSVVTVEYVGKLIDGTVFDSSEELGEPVSFSLNQIIPGWKEALMLMPVGSTWEVFIPSDLAYGPKGFGVIGPNETLIFEIELVSIDKDSEGSEN